MWLAKIVNSLFPPPPVVAETHPDLLREERRQRIATMTALVQSPRARWLLKLMGCDYELSMMKHRIKERCEKGRGIELAPIEVHYLLVYIREKDTEIKRLNKAIGYARAVLTTHSLHCQSIELAKRASEEKSKKG